MATQSAKGPLNSSIPGLPSKDGPGKYGGVALGGNRYDPNVSFTEWVNNPSPLGGLQGGQGKIFGIGYSTNNILGKFAHNVVETYAGAHDFLNSWAYDNSTGYIRNLNGIERTIGGITNPLNVVIATPIAVPTALPQTFNAAPSLLYGQFKGQD